MLLPTDQQRIQLVGKTLGKRHGVTASSCPAGDIDGHSFYGSTYRSYQSRPIACRSIAPDST